jgi:DNA polymerase-4
VYANHEKYIYTSIKIHRILLDFSDQVEVFSIDECFIDVTHLCGKGLSPEKIALEIKKRLKEETGITCSIGIGPNKVVAKIAAKMQKPDGLVHIREEKVPEIFSRLPVEELQGVGIGGRTASALKSLGIKTAADLGNTSLDLLENCFGVRGRMLRDIGLGTDNSPVKKYADNDPVKSVGHSHTFTEDSYDMNTVKSYLRMLCEKVGVRLREAGLTGRTIGLMVRYSDFHAFIMHRSLKHYIRTGFEIYRASYMVLGRVLPLKKAVRLLGVSISNLVIYNQGYLFPEFERENKLTDTVDSINSRYGEFTVKPSSLIIAEKHGILERCGLIGRYNWESREKS